MAEENKKGRAPDFVAREGVMIWKNTDRNGNPYLSVKIPLLNISVNCFLLDRGKNEN